MDQRIKELWVSALRSGEFRQCKGYLSKNDQYCALGVLSVLALLEGVCTFSETKGVGRFDNRKFTLSFNVMRWADISQDDERYLDPEEHKVKISYKGIITTVIDLNDKGLSFTELASLIEKNI